MPPTRTDELILHTAGDVLYFGTGRPQAAVFDHGPKEFVRQEWVQAAETVRLLGTRENAELIVALYNQALPHKRPRIYLGSPSLCRLEKDPPDVLRQLLEIEYPPSLGGWHTMTQADFTSYSLICAMAQKPAWNRHKEVLLEAHPAYPALAFLPTVAFRCGAQLLCEMVDPRFHVSPQHPESVSRLKQHFGLGDPAGLHNARAWLSKEATSTANRYDAASLVFGTWAEDWVDLLSKASVDFNPEAFLWRVAAQVYATKVDMSAAILRTSHVFMRFLRAVWLDRLTPSRKYRRRRRALGFRVKSTKVVRTMCQEKIYSPTMFVPEYFFVNQDEVEAWKRFLVQIKRV